MVLGHVASTAVVKVRAAPDAVYPLSLLKLYLKVPGLALNLER